MTPTIMAPASWARWGWIARSVAQRHGVTTAAMITGRRRTSLVCAARHDLMACLWGSGLAYAEIGRLLGRDHTTVLAAVRKEIGR